MNKTYHDFPEHIKALNAENNRLCFNMQNMEGEVKFLRSHLKDLISDIMAEGNYTATFPATKINGLWYELGLWHEAIAERAAIAKTTEVDDG